MSLSASGFARSTRVCGAVRQPTMIQGFDGVNSKKALLPTSVTSCALPSFFFIS